MILTSLLSQLNIETAPTGHHHSTGGWVQIDCPFCTPKSKRFRMGINKARLNCSCWGCGPHSLAEVLQTITDKSYKEVKELLAGVKVEIVERVVHTGTLKLPPGVEDFSKAHETYLFKRGFNPATLNTLWGVRGIGKMGREFSWRLFIPVQLNGETVSWTTRSISDDVASRYISAKPDQEKVHYKDLLYGEDYCRHSVVVVEGPTDVWRIGPGAVCTFGTGFTRAQVLRIAKYPVRAVCFDREAIAEHRARKLVEYLEGFPGETCWVRMATGKDPDDAAPEEVARLRKTFLDGIHG